MVEGETKFLRYSLALFVPWEISAPKVLDMEFREGAVH
jgi:hypothetical protein